MFEEDKSAFIEDFGEDFIHPDAGEFKAIFKDKYASYDNEYGISSFAPEIVLFTVVADLFSVGDVVTRWNSQQYELSDFQPDGTGLVRIRMFER
jgi:hypothetical protein